MTLSITPYFFFVELKLLSDVCPLILQYNTLNSGEKTEKQLELIIFQNADSVFISVTELKSKGH